MQSDLGAGLSEGIVSSHVDMFILWANFYTVNKNCQGLRSHEAYQCAINLLIYSQYEVEDSVGNDRLVLISLSAQLFLYPTLLNC